MSDIEGDFANGISCEYMEAKTETKGNSIALPTPNGLNNPVNIELKALPQQRNNIDIQSIQSLSKMSSVSTNINDGNNFKGNSNQFDHGFNCYCKYSTIYQVIIFLLVLYSCIVSTYNLIYKIENCECNYNSSNTMFTSFNTDNPSKSPIISTTIPTNTPSVLSTANPSNKPSRDVTNIPSMLPTMSPTNIPSIEPTNKPSNRPSKVPTKSPTIEPTNKPSNRPSISPTINDGGLRLFLFPSSVERFHVTTNWGPSDPKWGPQVIDLSGYNLPDNTKAIHGMVFITLNENDQISLVMGTLPLCIRSTCSLYTNNRGAVFGSPSNWDTSDNIVLTYHGDEEGFTSLYGTHYPSLTIPITLDKKLHWDATGRNNQNGFGSFIIFVTGYYAT